MNISTQEQYDSFKRARELLSEFKSLLKGAMTETERRNAARTFNDFAKILLMAFIQPEWVNFLGQVDLGKRFAFVVTNFPQLQGFSTLIKDCKSARDKVEHHDGEAPSTKVLCGWAPRAEELLRVASDALVIDETLLDKLTLISDDTGGLCAASLVWVSTQTGKLASENKMLSVGTGEIYHSTKWLVFRIDFGPHEELLFPSLEEAAEFRRLVEIWDRSENEYYVIDEQQSPQVDCDGHAMIAWRPSVELKVLNPFEAVNRFHGESWSDALEVAYQEARRQKTPNA